MDSAELQAELKGRRKVLPIQVRYLANHVLPNFTLRSVTVEDGVMLLNIGPEAAKSVRKQRKSLKKEADPRDGWIDR
jgi:hypothetical protein